MIEKMVMGHGQELTEDEAELYDRQIRLWGLESQKRLRNARVLIIGLKGLGAEIAKNIILSGVKTVTLLDDGLLTEEDICSQFLAPPEAVGSYRAVSSLTRAQALNPMVKVTADTSRIQSKTDDFFNDFDVVVATECSLLELNKINFSCRSKNIKFFCGEVYGMFGYLFADLLVHEYVKEITKLPQAKPELGKKKSEPVKVNVKEISYYVPLSEALSTDWSRPESAKKISKMDYSYFLMRVLMEFHTKFNRKPDPKKRSEDIESLKSLSRSVLKSLNAPEDKIPYSVFSTVFAEISPVCAIIGGVLSQEIVKAVTQRETPHNNFCFFNPEKCCGFVENHSNSD